MKLEAGFRIGDREVFPLEGRIAGPGGSLRIEPKAMAVLIDLARHAPALRTREEIVQVVWPRGFVTDDALTRCIGQLRKALGDDARAPACLETIPRRGYRLLQEVREAASGQVLQQPAEPTTESLIVLPFQNLSAAAEDYVADGLTELLILRLAGLKNIRTISRTTAMQFKGTATSLGEIATKTGVSWVVEGSVLQHADRMQVVVQLIDARTDAHVWAADYVRDLQELLPLQNEIAMRVASAIRLQLGAELDPVRPAPVLAPQVMRDYLHGRQLISQRTVSILSDARCRFEAVTAAAPDYAAGWASLAECEMLLAHYSAPRPERLLADCEGHIDRALTLHPDLGIGLSTRGAVRFFFNGDWDGAAADLERALNLLPSYTMAMLSMANVCAVQRDFAEATAWIEQALLVDPLDVGVNMNHGDHLILQRRYEEAVSALRRGLEIAPGHRPSQLRSCWALALDGQATAATALLASIGPAGDADLQWHEFAALVAGAAGDARTASAHYQTLQHLAAGHSVPAWMMARAAAAAAKVDSAIAWLETAARQRSSSMPFLFLTPAFDALHAHARFLDLGGSLPRPPGCEA